MSKKGDLPKDYFDKLPKRIFDSIDSIENALDKHAPLLSKMKDINPYKVPVGYFDKPIAKLPEKRREKIYLMPMKIAASVVFVMLVGWTVLGWNESEKLPDFAEADLIDYYIDNVDELDDELLHNVYAEALIESEEIYEEDVLLDILLTEFSDAELELY